MGYIGKLQFGNDENQRYAFGDILYVECNTPPSTAAKTIGGANAATVGDIDRYFAGIYIRVKFLQGNEVKNNVTLNINNIGERPVIGNCVCAVGEIIGFTYEEVSQSGQWVVTSIANGGIEATISERIQEQLGSNDAMIFKGTIGLTIQQATYHSLPATGYSAGWTYKVIESGDYGTVEHPFECQAGDLIIATQDAESNQVTWQYNHWANISGNAEGVVTGPSTPVQDGTIVLFDGTSGTVIKSSGVVLPNNPVFTDTAYEVTTDGQAYTAHAIVDGSGNTISGATINGQNNTQISILAEVTENGVLKLSPRIAFTTGTVGTIVGPIS